MHINKGQGKLVALNDLLQLLDAGLGVRSVVPQVVSEVVHVVTVPAPIDLQHLQEDSKLFEHGLPPHAEDILKFDRPGTELAQDKYQRVDDGIEGLSQSSWGLPFFDEAHAEPLRASLFRCVSQ